MNKHNRALDFIALAMNQARKGNIVRAAKLFSSALDEPDHVQAIKIIEASNAQALKVELTAKAEKLKAAAKPTKVKAAEDEIEDDLEDDKIEALAEEDGEPEGEPEEVEEEEMEEEDGDEAFAAVLASMRRKKAKPAAK